jgi:choline dehydrogenase-like flavoprotein
LQDGPDELTTPEQVLRWVMYAHALLSAVFVVGYAHGGIAHGEDFRFVANSVTKDGVFIVVSLLAASHPRRFGWLTLVLVAAYALLIASHVTMLIVGDHEPQRVPFGGETDATQFLWSWLAADVAILALFAGLYVWAGRARHRLGYLWPSSYRALAALAEVLVQGPNERITPDEIARNADRYLARLKARGKWRIQAALFALTAYPIVTRGLPFRAMAPERRLRFIKRRFVYGVAVHRPRGLLGRWRALRQAMIRVASQFAYLGYYGDARVHEAIGYVPFTQRPDADEKLKSVDHDRPGVGCLQAPPERADIVVVGSGAAGAIVAYKLAQDHPERRVLILERGPHIDMRRDFVEDEVEMYLRLYNEGALQVARDFRFQVLQGSCVGGSTTVNNAVCFKPPPAVIERWHEEGSSIEPGELDAAVARVSQWLHVDRVSPHIATRAAGAFARGVGKLGLDDKFDAVQVNIRDCLGCGYCNIGCAYGRKLSMLDSVLPDAQREFGDRVEVLPDFRVTGIERENGRVVAVHGEYEDGRPRIVANAVVLAAGAIGSSWVLQRSKLGAPLAGRSVYFNANSPLTAEFPEPVDAFVGLQMSHAYHPGEDEGYVLETWFNPPATQALAMPGWFEDHYRNMQRFRHMAAGGVLVGTTEPARLKAGRNGPIIDYTPGRRDFDKIVRGLKELGRIFLAGGAERVMPATYVFHEFSSPAALDGLDEYARDNSDLLLTSAHPQGGNPINVSPEHGVVDDAFRVHGLRNLYVCDASVLPSAITVNPQLTVMAVAELAARRIGETLS